MRLSDQRIQVAARGPTSQTQAEDDSHPQLSCSSYPFPLLKSTSDLGPITRTASPPMQARQNQRISLQHTLWGGLTWPHLDATARRPYWFRLHLWAGGHTSSEGDFGHITMLTQKLACSSPSLHHAEEPRRDSSLSIDFSQQQRRYGREGRRFKDHGVTCITETKTQKDF